MFLVHLLIRKWITQNFGEMKSMSASTFIGYDITVENEMNETLVNI